MEEKVYDIFEKIVGSEDISRDPAVLDGYAFQWMASWGPEKGNKFSTPRAAAVLLPESTEEVQSIVKTCNRHGVKFKPHSVGFGNHSINAEEGTIILDLRKMDSILEINEKDMYAVVEPYVTWVQLLSEAHKRGLDAPQIGTGGHTSALASCTSMLGMGYKNISMNYNEANILGVEWILPDGEILKLGSLGSGAGWITGDGPGPSLRGIMRGYCGGMGEMGVFTKCAVKLYSHWKAEELVTENLGPGIHSKNLPGGMRLSKMPEYTEFYIPSFENLEDRDEFIRKLGEEEIGYATGITGRNAQAFAMTDNYREAVDVKEFVDELPEISLQVLIAANSERELEYKKKLMESLLEETNGENPEYVANDPEMKKVLAFMLIKEGGIVLRAMGPTSTFVTFNTDSWVSENFGKAEQEAVKVLEENQTGDVMFEGPESMWGVVGERGLFGHMEVAGFYDPYNPESGDFLADLDRKIVERHIEKNIGSAPFQSPENVPMKLRPDYDAIQKYSHVDIAKWGRAIQRILDPNDVTESHMTPKKEDSTEEQE